MKLAHKMACAALVLAAAATAHAAPTRTWTVTALPISEYGGGARGVNNRGDVVGTYEVAQYYPHPAIWSNGAVTDILADNPTYGVANAVNDSGAVAATQRSGIIMWKDGVITPLNIAGEPMDINKFGAIVGYYYPCGEIACGPQRGFYWRDGVLQDIGDLGNNVNAALGVNDRGVVVGYARLPMSSDTRAVVWENGRLSVLPDLGGGTNSAGDITNHGVIMGSSTDPTGVNHLVTWDAGTGRITDIGRRLSGNGINDRGAIVGNNLDTGAAFLLEDGVFTWLLDLPAMREQGWTSFTPFDINERGWIVGIGYRPGSTNQGEPVVLVPENGGGKPKG
jgi:uncharacterized membrane protein